MCKQIDRVLVARTSSFRDIARQHRLSKDALLRHYDDHLPATLVRAHEAKEDGRALDLMSALEQCVRRVTLLSDACDEWLRDPEQPDRYDVGPRSEDVTVTYVETVGKKRVRRRATLSELLDMVNKVAPDVRTVEVKHADPRTLLVKTADSLRGQLELLAKLVGKLKEGGTVNVFVGAEWRAVESVILATLAPHPAIRVQVAEALERLAAARSN